MIRKSLLASLSAAALLTATVAVTSPATAAADCSVVDFAPATVAMGIGSFTNVQFDVGTDCEEDAEVFWYLKAAWPDAPTVSAPMVANFEPPAGSGYTHIPGGKYQWPRATDQRAGVMDVGITAYVDVPDDPENALPVVSEKITVLHRTTFGSTFNASPEPRRKGQTIKIVGQVKYADWTNNRYKGFGTYVMLQFRPLGAEEYSNVKWVWNNGVEARTKVKAVKSGTWRYRYYGDAANAAVNSKGDYVVVNPAR
jgi:hypothetical protein